LHEMYARARSLGYVMSEDAARSSEDFTDKMTDMKAVMIGVRTTIGNALMPVFGKWMAQLTELITKHQPQIEAWAKRFAADLPGRLQQLKNGFQELLVSLQPVFNFASGLVERFGLMETVAGGLALIVGAPLIVPFISLTAALFGVAAALTPLIVGLGTLAVKAIPLVIAEMRLLTGAMMANPVFAIATAIALAAGLIIAHWDKIGPWFQAMWGKVSEAFSEAWSGFTEWLGWDPLEVLRPVWGGITTYFSNVFGAVKRLLNGDWTALQDLFKWSPLGLLQQSFGKAIEWLSNINWREHGRRLVDTLVEGIKSIANKPVQMVRDMLGKVRNLLPFSDAKEGPLSALTKSGRALPETLAQGVRQGGRSLENEVANLGGSRVSVPAPLLGTPMARGGAAASGVTVQRVDFRPQVTIQVATGASADDIGAAVEERLERMRARDLWVTIQGVQAEAAG
jgi:hypothetical protein